MRKNTIIVDFFGTFERLLKARGSALTPKALCDLKHEIGFALPSLEKLQELIERFSLRWTEAAVLQIQLNLAQDPGLGIREEKAYVAEFREENITPFSTWFNAALGAKKKGHQAMSAESGIHVTQIYRWSRGMVTPTKKEQLKKIAAYLGPIPAGVLRSKKTQTKNNQASNVMNAK